MTPIGPLLFLFVSLVSGEVTEGDVILLEIDPRDQSMKVLEKRQVQYGQQQISPEYAGLLEQLQAQQLQQAEDQQSPALLSQALNSRMPQTFNQPPRPPRPSPIPPEERRLQESIVMRNLRAQEAQDQQNQQLIALGIDPSALRRQLLRENIARQAAEEAATRSAQEAARQQQPQYYSPQVLQTQIVPIPESIPVQQGEETQQIPDRVSYSQVQFGSSRLPKQAFNPGRTRLIQYNSQPGERPATQQVVYRQPSQQIQQVTYSQPSGELPQQYLIETTKPQRQQQQQPREEQVYQVPRRVVYRPQANYQDLQSSLLAQQEQARYNQQQLESATQSPPHSAIYVSTARTPAARIPQQYTTSPQEFRIPKAENQRVLTQSELNALIGAGFKVSPSEDSFPRGQRQQYYNGLRKRQSRPVPEPVQLTEEEKEELSKQGIRSIYRIAPDEREDSGITYVLALDKQKEEYGH